jgi:DnaJ-class molecular chaperone
LPTQENRDYYDLLGVTRSATTAEMESAFQRLEKEFHAAGKPENIDDVEWLRQLKKAHDVLCDGNRRGSYDRTGQDFELGSGPSFGYDSGSIKQMNFQVDKEIKERRILMFVRWILDFFNV